MGMRGIAVDRGGTGVSMGGVEDGSFTLQIPFPFLLVG